MPPPITQLPVINGMYRLCNLEKKSYIELTDALKTPKGRITARKLANSFDQIWFFYNTGDNKYQIMSTSAPGIWLGAKFNPVEGGIEAYPAGRNAPTEWSIRRGRRGDGFQFFTPTDRKREAVLNLSSDGSVILFNETDSLRQIWDIIPAAPSAQTAGSFASPIAPYAHSATLPNGSYRIRNLNPSCVLTLSASGVERPQGRDRRPMQNFNDDTVYVEQQDKTLQQRWELAKADTGYYSIQSSDTYKYLSYVVNDSRNPRIVMSDRAAEWQLESVGGFGFVLAVPETPYAVGFADYRADLMDKVTLVDNIHAHCQIWLCESWRILQEDEQHRPKPLEENFDEEVSESYPPGRRISTGTGSQGYGFLGD